MKGPWVSKKEMRWGRGQLGVVGGYEVEQRGLLGRPNLLPAGPEMGYSAGRGKPRGMRGPRVLTREEFGGRGQLGRCGLRPCGKDGMGP
jgi:hypothetical protein